MTAEPLRLWAALWRGENSCTDMWRYKRSAVNTKIQTTVRKSSKSRFKQGIDLSASRCQKVCVRHADSPEVWLSTEGSTFRRRAARSDESCAGDYNRCATLQDFSLCAVNLFVQVFNTRRQERFYFSMNIIQPEQQPNGNTCNKQNPTKPSSQHKRAWMHTRRVLAADCRDFIILLSCGFMQMLLLKINLKSMSHHWKIKMQLT